MCKPLTPGLGAEKGGHVVDIATITDFAVPDAGRAWQKLLGTSQGSVQKRGLAPRRLCQGGRRLVGRRSCRRRGVPVCGSGTTDTTHATGAMENAIHRRRS